MRASQQRVELLELAALALPAHPAALALVPDAAPVQQQEALGAVALGQLPQLFAGGRHKRHILGHVLLGRVGKVGEQRKVQVRVRVGERSHLQAVQLVANALTGKQQRRHHHHRG